MIKSIVNDANLSINGKMQHLQIAESEGAPSIMVMEESMIMPMERALGVIHLGYQLSPVVPFPLLVPPVREDLLFRPPD